MRDIVPMKEEHVAPFLRNEDIALGTLKRRYGIDVVARGLACRHRPLRLNSET